MVKSVILNQGSRTHPQHDINIEINDELVIQLVMNELKKQHKKKLRNKLKLPKNQYISYINSLPNLWNSIFSFKL